jgi:signal transduction histidine kinase
VSAQLLLAETIPAIAVGDRSAGPRWLPCVRYRSDRWWLPLSRQAVDVLAATLLRDPDDAWRVAAIEERLRVDPPLLIFSALATTAADDSPQQSLSIAELAEKLSLQLISLLASGDSALGTPAPARGELNCASLQYLFATWGELHQRFLRLPRSQWLVAAGEWLQLTGPAVPADWQQTWPRLVNDVNLSAEAQSADACYAPSELDLVTLARTIRRSQSLEDRFQDTLRNAKRAALKQFAYGLSHEINNPLANISTRAQTLLRDEPHPERGNSLQRIVDQTMRAHEMVADLMFYAHPPAPQMRAVDLHEIVRAVVAQSLESVEGRGIELLVSPSSQNLTVVVDRNMLLEAVRALVRNSIEAIGCDGRVQLDCFCETVGAETPAGGAGGRAPSVGAPPLVSLGHSQSLAVITVSDSGPGLSDAARIYAFDPYFSGREAGRGLGVGLCRVERIAQLHGGDVTLQSGPAGCIARLWIPQAT